MDQAFIPPVPVANGTGYVRFWLTVVIPAGNPIKSVRAFAAGTIDGYPLCECCDQWGFQCPQGGVEFFPHSVTTKPDGSQAVVTVVENRSGHLSRQVLLTVVSGGACGPTQLIERPEK